MLGVSPPPFQAWTPPADNVPHEPFDWRMTPVVVAVVRIGGHLTNTLT